MSSPAQIEANRRNAQRSTGPKTPEGKETSRQNALRHGLAAETVALLPDEDEAEFRLMAEALHQSLDPQDAYEEVLVRRVVLLSWRLDRIPRIEATYYPTTMAQMPNLTRYEAMLDRAMERAMKMLREHKAERIARRKDAAAVAERIAERSQYVAERSREWDALWGPEALAKPKPANGAALNGAMAAKKAPNGARPAPGRAAV
jgi:hypothetical protein